MNKLIQLCDTYAVPVTAIDRKNESIDSTPQLINKHQGFLAQTAGSPGAFTK